MVKFDVHSQGKIAALARVDLWVLCTLSTQYQAQLAALQL